MGVLEGPSWSMLLTFLLELSQVWGPRLPGGRPSGCRIQPGGSTLVDEFNYF